jgi:hypothetical protein
MKIGDLIRRDNDRVFPDQMWVVVQEAPSGEYMVANVKTLWKMWTMPELWEVVYESR